MVYAQNPDPFGYILSDNEVEQLEEHLNSKENAILIVNEGDQILFPDSVPLMSRFKRKEFEHVSFYSGERLSVHHQVNLTWSVGTPDLLSIISFYQQPMVYCPATPIVYAFAELFSELNGSQHYNASYLKNIR